MAPARTESAGDIAKRYGLAELVRARMVARRLALNALARTASASMQGSLDLIYPDLAPSDVDTLITQGIILPDDPVVPRAALPAYETRLYNRRLTEMEALRLDANDRAERLLDRYLTRSRARAAIAQSGSNAEGEADEQEGDNPVVNSHDQDGENGGKKKSKTKRAEEDETEDEELGELLEEEYENRFLDLYTTPYESPVWRRAGRRLLRHRLLPFRYRSLPLTRRALERRSL